MKYYYSATTCSFYPLESKKTYEAHNSWPTDATEASESEWQRYGLTSPPTGKARGSDILGRPCWVDVSPNTTTDFQIEESAWVRCEIDRVRCELEKVEDSDPKAVGTISQWREYRKAVRSWSDHVQFPYKEFRPKAPDSNNKE